MNFKRFLSFISAMAICSAFSSCSSEKAGNITVDEVPTASDEFITPAEDSEEYDLGAYQVSQNGVKYYYDTEVAPKELMNALERYFTSYQQCDFEAYKECLFQGYADRMEEYLQKNYEYGLETSFMNQCDNLKEMAGGEFTITRIRAIESESESPETFFETYDELFETDYYTEINENSDKLYDLYFSIMTKAEGEETESLIISDFEIVFAEKDGNFYTFG